MANDSDKHKSNIASLADARMRVKEAEANRLKADRINRFRNTMEQKYVDLQLIRTEQVPTYNVFTGEQKNEVTLTFNRQLTVDELQILHRITEYFTQVKS